MIPTKAMQIAVTINDDDDDDYERDALDLHVQFGGMSWVVVKSKTPLVDDDDDVSDKGMHDLIVACSSLPEAGMIP